MVSNQNDMLGSFQYGYQRFWLRRLCSFINENLLKFHRLQPLIESRNTSRAYDIRIPHDFIFGLSLQILVRFLIFFVQLALLFFQTHQILHSLVRAMLQMFYLFMQWNVVDVGSYWLPWSCTQSNNLQACAVDLLSQLVNSDIGWCTD